MNVYSRSLVGLVAIAGSLLTAPGASAAYSGFYVFGDSLNDAGNWPAGSLPPPFNSPLYNAGHFTNGLTWTEDLAASLGFTLAPSTQGGTDFAWGNATTGAPNSQPGPLPPFDVAHQVGTYLTGTGNHADPNALYVVAGGGNDFFQGDMSQVPFNLGNLVATLATAGAKHFLVPNLPDFSLIPYTAGYDAATRTAIRNGTLAVNGGIAAALASVGTAFSVDIVLFDMFGLTDAAATSPGLFGFTNPTAPCFDAASGTACTDPDKYVYWDIMHPTAKAHQVIAGAALQTLNAASVPLPGASVLFAPALMLIATRLRKAV